MRRPRGIRLVDDSGRKQKHSRRKVRNVAKAHLRIRFEPFDMRECRGGKKRHPDVDAQRARVGELHFFARATAAGGGKATKAADEWHSWLAMSRFGSESNAEMS